MSTPVDRAPLLTVPDGGERDELAGFTARVVQLDATSVVRLRAVGDQVVAWATTPFEVLATRAVHGQLHPADLTVPAAELLASLAVVRHAEVDPGSRADARWRAELPPAEGWRTVGEVPAAELAALSDQGLAEARERADHGHHGGAAGGSRMPPAELLDRPVRAPGGSALVIPLRCLFTLSGLGYLAGGDAALVRVSSTGGGDWLRLDVPDGAVVRRRRALLPLVF